MINVFNWLRGNRWFGIRKRLLLGFIVLVSLATVTEIVILYGMVRAQDRWSRLDRDLYDRQRLAYGIRAAFGEEISFLRAFFAYGDPSLPQNVYYWRREAEELLEEAGKLEFPDYLDDSNGTMANFETELLSQLTQLHAQIESLFDQEIELKTKGHSSQWRELAATYNVDYVNNFIMRIDRYVKQADELYERGREMRLRERNLVLARLGFLVGLSLALAIVFGIILTRSIAWPIRKLSDATQELAAGNFRLLTGSFAENEIGDLARSFNEMAVALEERQAYILQRNKELMTLNQLVNLLSKATRLSEYAEQIVTMIMQTLPANAVAFYVGEFGNDGFILKASQGLPAHFGDKGENVLQVDRVLDSDIEAGRNIVFDSLDEVESELAEILRHEGLSSAILVPISNKQTVRGLLLVCARGLRRWPEEQRSLLSTMGRQISLVCENLELIQERVRSARFAAMGQAISDVGHTVKNLIAGMEASTFMLDHAIEEQEMAKVPQLLSVLKDVTERISTFMSDLLSFSKVEQLNIQTTSVRDVFGELLTLHGHQADSENTSLHTSVSNGEIVAKLDRKAIVGALSNLIVNSLHAVKQNHSNGMTVRGSIIVEAEATDEHLTIRVQDNGCGIEPDQQERIWETFYTTKGSRGTGLGLSLVRRVIEQHGGRISVSSTRGKGTAFNILLPLGRPSGESKITLS